MSNHVTQWLSAYLDGELTGRQLQQVEEHLAECEACQAELDSLQDLSRLLQEVPVGEFIPNERFVSQVNLRLPQQQVKPISRNNIFDVGWWLIPVSLLMIWIFIGTTTLVSDAVSAADQLGLLDSTTASFISAPLNTANVTSTLGEFGVLSGNSLQWAERSESYTREVFPQFFWQISIGVLYLSWIAIWWARHTRHARQPDGQLLEG